ncbi:MAG: glycosyltransferase family 4 protein [Anaerolineae bacterium]|nr:glycosyltransferase family 4 protein [Anaerolineae bacterium]MCI0608138.1 glycosyltransferase family 4 protein [Anaerolineae bacterium]
MMTKDFPDSEKKHFSILLIGTQMAIGGAQRGLFDQARWFKSHGCKVVVAFFYDKEGFHEKWKQLVDFPVHNLQAYKRGAGLLRQSTLLLRGLWRLWGLLIRERFDVVETFTHDSNLLGLPPAWFAQVPVRIATHRGKIEAFPRWRQILHSVLINIGIAHTLIAVSEQTRQQAMDEGVWENRITVIPNGVKPLDTSLVNRVVVRKDLGLNESDIFLLSIGRLTYQKGHEFLVQAMSEVVNHFPNAKAGICGDGPLHSQLEKQILQAGLSNHVRLLGAWEDVSPLLASTEIFILPSRWEGLSRALMEAMAAGLPVIAAQVDGIRDLITDGVNGLLVPSEDAGRLGNSILQLIEDAEMRKRLAAAGQAHVLQTHSVDDMCKKYYDLMLGLLQANHPV